MSYAPHRSNVKELLYGINDSVYKDSHINWANIQTDDSTNVRRQMDKIWHGFNEAQTKYLPDGRSYQTKGAAEIGSSDEDYH
jgi:hypothetical protein